MPNTDTGGNESGTPADKNNNKGNTVPLSTLLELKERLRDSEREMSTLKEMLAMRERDMQVSRQSNADPELDKDIAMLDENAQKGINALVEKVLRKERQQIGNVVLPLMDKNDLLEFQLRAGKDHDKYAKRVEAEVSDYRRRNMRPPERRTIFETLKAQDVSKKYERIIAESEKNGGKVNLADVQDDEGNSIVQNPGQISQEQFANIQRSNPAAAAVLNSLNMGGMAGANSKPQKSFRDLSTEEKEAALSDREL